MRHMTPEMIAKAERIAAGMRNVLHAATDGAPEIERHAVIMGAVISCANSAVATASAQDPAFGRLVAQAIKNNVDRTLAGEFPACAVARN